MQIMNTFVAKIGSGGKRNRAARRRMERRAQFQGQSSTGNATETLVVPEVVVDLAGSWDESVAKKALKMFGESGKSQRAFASEHGFPESRLRSWKKKFETLELN